MDSENKTFVHEFILLGLTDIAELKLILFGLFSICYVTNLIGNLSILVITILDPTLHNPMYFFLWNLALLDIFYSSVSVPKMLTGFLSIRNNISFGGCITQIYFFHFFGSTEALILTSMSYDRYVAIGKPLHYSITMNTKVCLSLALTSWMIGCFHALLHAIMTARLTFCGPNTVKHFFCDVKPLLVLACSDISLNLKLINIVTGTVVITALFLTVLSYVFIGKHLIKIRSTQGRKHALSTCTAHLAVVFIQLGTAIFIYVRSSTQSSIRQDRAASVLFSVFTPILYPIIYTLRNKDMKRAIKKFIKRRIF
ncbi:olfactory receptor 12D1-like [Discoglossus pictus]